MKTFPSFLLIVLIVIVLIATNPTQADFNSFVEENLKDELPKSKETNWIYETIKKVFPGQSKVAVSSTIEAITKPMDYYIFSTYEINLSSIELSYIGIAGRFFLIKQTIYFTPADEAAN